MAHPYDGQGEADEELAMLRSLSPQQQRAMLAAGLGGPRLEEFKRARGDNEDTIRRQMEQAQEMAFRPVEAQGRTSVAQGMNLAANALRMFGGLAVAGMKSGELGDARRESENQFEDIMGQMSGGRGAAIDAKRSGLSRALRSYGGDPLADPNGKYSL